MTNLLDKEQPFEIRRTPSNRFTIDSCRVDRPGNGGLLLRIDTAGLCGTDIQIVRGMRSETATVLGHEACCTVLEVGQQWADRYKQGDRVTINPTSATDTEFLLGHSVEGVWASHYLATDYTIGLGQVVKLPNTIDPVLAVLVEPLACAIYSWSILQQSRHERVVVFGDGTIGRLVAWLARRSLGSAAVIMASRQDLQSSAGRSRISEAMQGSVGVVVATPRDSTAECVQTALSNVGSGSIVDVIGGLEAASDPTLQQVATIRGQNVCGQPSIPKMLDLHLGRPGPRRLVRVTGHRGVAPEHMARAADLIIDNGEQFRALVTHVLNPQQATEAFNEIATRGSRDFLGRRIIKLVMDFREGAAR